MAEGTIKVNDGNFDAEVLQSRIPVLVDFWAEWCGPCRRVGPILEEIAGEYAGRIRIAKYNVDETREVATKHGIMSIPALLFFKDGELVDSVVGALPKSEITKRIDAVL